LLARADYCLVPTGQSPADLNSVTEWMGVLKREQVRAAFLLNRTKRQAKSFERARSNRANCAHLTFGTSRTFPTCMKLESECRRSAAPGAERILKAFGILYVRR
jgi:hypothetical protein